MNCLSQNVIEETAKALENSKDLFDAADELDISEQGLIYRIKSYPELMDLAIRKGLYKPREKQQPAPPAIPKPGFHRMDIQVPDDVYSDLVKMADLDMRPVNIQAVWLLKRVLAPIGAKEVLCGS